MVTTTSANRGRRMGARNAVMIMILAVSAGSG
jgi:hypothetical protein